MGAAPGGWGDQWLRHQVLQDQVRRYAAAAAATAAASRAAGAAHIRALQQDDSGRGHVRVGRCAVHPNGGAGAAVPWSYLAHGLVAERWRRRSICTRGGYDLSERQESHGPNVCSYSCFLMFC